MGRLSLCPRVGRGASSILQSDRRARRAQAVRHRRRHRGRRRQRRRLAQPAALRQTAVRRLSRCNGCGRPSPCGPWGHGAALQRSVDRAPARKPATRSILVAARRAARLPAHKAPLKPTFSARSSTSTPSLNRRQQSPPSSPRHCGPRESSAPRPTLTPAGPYLAGWSDPRPKDGLSARNSVLDKYPQSGSCSRRAASVR